MSFPVSPTRVEARSLRPPDHLDLPAAAPFGVTVVRWPEEESIRSALAALGRPRLLLLDPGVAPPVALDGAEDWLRWPPDPDELALRASHLLGRVVPVDDRPLILDEDGMLRRGDRWVSITEAQLPMLRLLLEHAGRVVRLDAVTDAYRAAGGSGHPASVRSNIARLRARIRPLGVDLVSVRQRGFLLLTLPPGVRSASRPSRPVAARADDA